MHVHCVWYYMNYVAIISDNVYNNMLTADQHVELTITG